VGYSSEDCSNLEFCVMVRLRMYATVVREVTEDGTVSKILMEKDGRPVDNVAENDEEGGDDVMLTLSDAVNMVLSFHHFLMTWEDVPDSVLESCDIVQEFMDNSLLKQTAQKKITDFLCYFIVSFFRYNYFVMCNYCSDILLFHFTATNIFCSLA